MPDEGVPLLKYMADKFGEDAAKRISRGKGPIVEPGKKVVGKVWQGLSFFCKYLFVIISLFHLVTLPSYLDKCSSHIETQCKSTEVVSGCGNVEL